MNCLDWSSDNKHLASGSFDKTVRIWNIEQGICVSDLRAHSREVNALAFNPKNDDQLVSASDDRLIEVWSLADGQCKQTLRGHS